MTIDTGAGGGEAGGGFSAALLTGDVDATAAAAAGGGDGAADGAGDGTAGDGDAAKGDPWFATLSDEAPDDKTLSDRKYVENKKWGGMEDAIKSYRQLEAQFSGEKVVLPKGPEDKDGWDRLFKAAGRPDAPDGYKFDAIANVDPALTGAFAPVAHSLGLSQAQAEGVARFNEAMVAEQAKATATAHAGEVTAMRKEAGTDGFNAMLERGLRAAERFGLAPDELAALRQTVGPRKLVTLLDNIGQAMGEDGMVGGGRKDMGMTPAKAEARKAEILIDKEFQARLGRKEATAVAEWNLINQVLGAAAEKVA